MKNTFCYAPFAHMYLQPGEYNSICCKSTEFRKRNLSNGVNVGSIDTKTHWSSDYYKDIRTRMFNGEELEHCTECYDAERNGGYSDRMGYNDRYQDIIEPNIEFGNQYKKPIDLDIRASNLCNLKCRMCGPESSSQIHKEILDNYKNFGDMIDKFAPNALNFKSVDWYNKKNREFLLNENTLSIKILGGEPTIMPEVDDMLDYLIENDRTDVHLRITTNLTNSNKRFVGKLEKFSNISFNYSIDGIGKVVEYIRNPVKFKSIEDNIKIYNQIGRGDVIFTLQAYNLFNACDTISWCNDLGIGIFFNKLNSPVWLSVDVIPKKYRDPELLKLMSFLEEDTNNNMRIKSIIQHHLSSDTEHNPQNFLMATEALDRLRNQSLKDSIPELWSIFNA